MAEEIIWQQYATSEGGGMMGEAKQREMEEYTT